MKVKHHDIEPLKDKPFANCKLEREQYAVVLTDLIRNFSDGFVLSIDNEWGTGKTTFVKMWKQHLENNEFKTLYYNAWENDFENDVLITLISELKELQTNKTKDKFESVITKAAPLAKSVTLGVLKTQLEKHVGKEATQEILNQASSSIADGITQQIQKYTNKKKSIADFKLSLQDFVKSTDDEKPVVFIIDELDRCRPDYAVQFLERIKHLFSVTGIVFVLSIDKIQLGNAVRGFYGSDLIDSDEYLRRFIDIEYSIPKPNQGLFISYLYNYYDFDFFFRKEERLQAREIRDDKSDFVAFASFLFDYGNLTLRLQEKIFAHARIALSEFHPQHYLIPGLYILLIYLKIKHSKIYKSIKNDLFDIQELIDNVTSVLPTGIPEDKIRHFIYTEAMLVKLYNNVKERNLREQLFIADEQSESANIKLLIKSGIDPSPDNKTFAEFIDTRRYHSNINEMNIKYLIKKIDLTESIILT